MSSQPVSRPRRRALAAGAAGAVLLLAACGTGEPDTAASDTDARSVQAGRDDEAGGATSASEAEVRIDTSPTATEPTAPAAAPPPTTDTEGEATDEARPTSEPGATAAPGTDAAGDPEPSGGREPAPVEPEPEPTGERATATEPARPQPEPTGEPATTTKPARPEPEPEPTATPEEPAPAEPEDPPPSPEETPTAPANASVRVVDFGYGPQAVQVAPGGTVTWTFDGPTTHTVTFGGGGPDSGFVEAGGSFSASFATPGSFGYVCQLHGNMRGTVTVG